MEHTIFDKELITELHKQTFFELVKAYRATKGIAEKKGILHELTNKDRNDAITIAQKTAFLTEIASENRLIEHSETLRNLALSLFIQKILPKISSKLIKIRKHILEFFAAESNITSRITEKHRETINTYLRTELMYTNMDLNTTFIYAIINTESYEIINDHEIIEILPLLTMLFQKNLGAEKCYHPFTQFDRIPTHRWTNGSLYELEEVFFKKTSIQIMEQSCLELIKLCRSINFSQNKKYQKQKKMADTIIYLTTIVLALTVTKTT
jgi:hypothetical protein